MHSQIQIYRIVKYNNESVDNISGCLLFVAAAASVATTISHAHEFYFFFWIYLDTTNLNNLNEENLYDHILLFVVEKNR